MLVARLERAPDIEEDRRIVCLLEAGGRARWLLPLLTLTLAAGPALASFSGGGSSKPSSPGSAPGATEQKSARQQAEQWYHDAYEDVTKAKEALADTTDPKKAAKLFRRAIDRAGRALEYDKTYHEAYNLQGFAWRNLGDYDQSVAAYEKCLGLKPDYAPAREYYGQALLAKGDREGAEIQLMWLKRLKADDLVKQLETAMAEAAPAEPSAAAKPAAKPAPAAKADSAAAGDR